MTPEELDRLVEWNEGRCHYCRCDQPATLVYTKRQRADHRPYRYQRCAHHPVADADSVTPFASRPPHSEGTPA